MISCAGTGGDDSSKGCASHFCQRRTRYRSNSRQTDGNSGCSLRGEGSNNSKINKKTPQTTQKHSNYVWSRASRSVGVPALPPGELKGITDLPARTSPFCVAPLYKGRTTFSSPRGSDPRQRPLPTRSPMEQPGPVGRGLPALGSSEMPLVLAF